VYWILAAIFLIVALAVPRLRPIGVVGSVILGALLAWGVVQRLRSGSPELERGQPVSPAAQLQAVPIDLIDAQELRLSGAGAPFELRGRIVNRATDAQLKSVTIQLTRRDCYEGALGPDGCVVLWQDRHWIPISVPPSEVRDFAVSIWARGAAARPRGTVEDSFELQAAQGEKVERAER
jgi:hypothetical protein